MPAPVVGRRHLLAILGGLVFGGLLVQLGVRQASALIFRCDTCTACPTGEHRCAACCLCCQDQSGIAGGGPVRMARGRKARVALSVSRQDESSDGRVSWLERAWEHTGLALESVVIAIYRPTEGVPGGREVWGLMSANGAGQYLFVLRAVAAGPLGEGGHTVSLKVGDPVLAEPELAADLLANPQFPMFAPTGFSYETAGTLTGGGFVLLPHDPETP